jgi:hypothetical protein
MSQMPSPHLLCWLLLAADTDGIDACSMVAMMMTMGLMADGADIHPAERRFV